MYPTIVVALLGVASGIATWFLVAADHKFSVDGFTSGLALVALNLLIGFAIVKPPKWFTEHFDFLFNGFGRGIFLLVVGLLFAGTHGLFVACWVIYWLLGAVYLALFFSGKAVLLTGGQGFKEAPDSEEPQAGQPIVNSQRADPLSNEIAD
jgi:hypothetical protein